MKDTNTTFKLFTKAAIFTFVFAALISYTTSAFARPNDFCTEHCSNGNTSWSVTTFDDNGNITSYTWVDCLGGPARTWRPSIINPGHKDTTIIGYLYTLTDSVSFTTSGANWAVIGYTGTTAMYEIAETGTGPHILFGGYSNIGSGNPNPSAMPTLGTPNANTSKNSISNLKVTTLNGKLIVSFSFTSPIQARVEVFDELGRVKNNCNVDILNSGQATIQLPQALPMPSGSYFVRITGGGAIATQKIVIAK